MASPFDILTKPRLPAIDSIPKQEEKNIDDKRAAYIQNKIKQKKGASLPAGAPKEKFSRRVILTRDSERMAVVCEATGAVMALDVPSIPGHVFTIHSPLAVYNNCRGIAQQGAGYLNKLQTQTLAAVLITLADNYSLLHFQPSDSGAQKNAILRTASKELIIDSILMIEDLVNSMNQHRLPRLSLILDTDVQQNGIHARMQEWQKACIDAIYKPDLRTYDEIVKPQKSITPYTTARANKEKIALRKEFRQWKKDAKPMIAGLYAKQKISIKLKAILDTLTIEDNMLSADVAVVDLLCLKLRQLEHEDTTELAKNISYFKNRMDEMQDNGDWLDELSPFSSSAPGVYEATKEEKQSAEDEAFADSPAPAPSAPVQSVQAGKPVSFVERIKMLKAKQSSVQEQPINEQELPDAPF